MSAVTITEFLLARIAEDEKQADYLLKGLEADIAENYAGMVDERGPMTPSRKLSAEMWATHDGQSKARNFAKGQAIAYLANPSRVLAECAAKRAILGLHERVLDPHGGKDGATCSMCTEVGPNAQEYPRDTLKALASVYKDHRDYRHEWADARD